MSRRLEELASDGAIGAEALEDAAHTFVSGACPAWAILAITFTNKAADEMKSRLAGSLIRIPMTVQTEKVKLLQEHFTRYVFVFSANIMRLRAMLRHLQSTILMIQRKRFRLA